MPCGDANWQFETRAVDAIGAYAGLDIVPSVVAFNVQRFTHHSNKHFASLDFAACELPRLRWVANASSSAVQPFELVHSRDVFQHMRTSSALRAIHHVVGSGARLLIATTFAAVSGGIRRSAGQQHESAFLPLRRQAARRQERVQQQQQQHPPTRPWPLGSWLLGGRTGGRALHEDANAVDTARGRALRGDEERDSPVVPAEGGFAHVDLSARPFVLPPAIKCVASHPTIEPDLTCLYVLSTEWKAEWRARQARCGRACKF